MTQTYLQRSVARFARVLALSIALIAPGVLAQNSTAVDPEAEAQAAFAAAKAVMQAGPADIAFRDQATLKLPAGYVFVPSKEAARILKSMGNRVGDDLIGVIFPNDGANWFVSARYIASGYIKDDDAKDWKADELLDNIKTGTEEANRERKSRGIPEIEVLGWVERPHYDAASHRLVWALSSKEKGTADSAEKGINYNTYALGREGYVSLNLVTDLRSVEAQKPIAQQFLAALNFADTKRYADFNSSTDHIAEYGLAALVGGIAAKKLGMLALIIAFGAKFFKIIAVAVIGGLAVFGKFFKRNKTPEAPKA